MNEVSVGAALVAGVVSFLSPCVLPLVPGYLSYVSGVSVAELGPGGGGAVAAATAAGRGAVLRTATVNAGAFVLGFTTIFVLLGASATAIGSLLLVLSPWLRRAAGVVIVIFGLHIMGVLKIPFLYRETRVRTAARPKTLLGSYGVGMAFAFGWTPCIGPILAGVLGLAATQETVAQGMGLLTVYSLGLGVPFMAAALGVNYLAAFVGRFRRLYRYVEIVAGLLLVGIGILVFTGSLTWIAARLTFLNPFVL